MLSSQQTPQRLSKGKIHNAFMEWYNDDSCNTNIGPHLPNIVCLLQTMGFKLRQFEKCNSTDVDDLKMNKVRISIACGTSQMMAVLELDSNSCVCPDTNKNENGSFWSISGTGSIGNAENQSKVEESGSNLLPALPKELTITIEHLVHYIFEIITKHSKGNIDENRNSVDKNIQKCNEQSKEKFYKECDIVLNGNGSEILFPEEPRPRPPLPDQTIINTPTNFFNNSLMVDSDSSEEGPNLIDYMIKARHSLERAIDLFYKKMALKSSSTLSLAVSECCSVSSNKPAPNLNTSYTISPRIKRNSISNLSISSIQSSDTNNSVNSTKLPPRPKPIIRKPGMLPTSTTGRKLISDSKLNQARKLNSSAKLNRSTKLNTSSNLSTSNGTSTKKLNKTIEIETKLKIPVRRHSLNESKEIKAPLSIWSDKCSTIKPKPPAKPTTVGDPKVTRIIKTTPSKVLTPTARLTRTIKLSPTKAITSNTAKFGYNANKK